MTLCLTCRNEDSCVETDLRKIRGECEYYKPTTNADRIRSMSDEELAEWMANKVDCQYCSVRSAWCSESKASCRTNWLDWLRQEAEEGET